jgi:hypothetical protein
VSVLWAYTDYDLASAASCGTQLDHTGHKLAHNTDTA